jgi:hypothetical protein
VATLIYQLATETERGCWRIDLYSLVDLWHWRSQSRSAFRSAMVERSESVQEIIARLKHDAYCDAWPELSEFEEVAKACFIDLD